MMGYSDWSDEAYKAVTSKRATAGRSEIFKSTSKIDPLMDPRSFEHRESRDSEHHPESVPILVGFDVTGSMGHIPTSFAKEHLGDLMRKLTEEGRVTDPQVLIAAIGDAVSDRAPLQVGQFESGLEMDQWLTRVWLEGRGGDIPESYSLLHYFAAHRTKTDAWEKRARKGYCFTIGDAPNKPLAQSQVSRVFGGEPPGPFEDAAVFEHASERYHVFHVLVSRKNQSVPSRTVAGWEQALPGRVIVLNDYTQVCDVIAGLIGLVEGTTSPASVRDELSAVTPNSLGNVMEYVLL